MSPSVTPVKKIETVKYSPGFKLGVVLAFIGFSSPAVFGQRGEIESQTYEIVKQKSIEFPAASKAAEKGQIRMAKDGESKIKYQFVDPKVALSVPKITPAVIASTDQNERMEQPEPLSNYIKIGAGNFGRFLGDAFISGQKGEDLVLTGEVKHLSASTGPVGGKLSANANTLLRVGAKYLTTSYKVDGSLEYNRRGYYFYGFQPQPSDFVVNRDSLRQRNTIFGVKLGLSNTDPSTTIDYNVVTAFNTFADAYNASEMDWGTNIKTGLPISDTFFALFDADIYVSKRSDAERGSRNLFRVKPSFKYSSGMFAFTAGINVVNETDAVLNINRTKAFPVLNLDVSPSYGVHIFAGWNGDVVRNTYRSLVTENPWLAPNVIVANTIKDSDINAGIKGEMDALNFEAKVSYANYRNLYFFNNSLADTSKFSVLYEGKKANLLTISGDLGYTFSEMFKSSLKVGLYRYDLQSLEQPWHRPKSSVTWFNSLTVSKKLFLTTELYVYTGIQAKNFQTGVVTKLPAITDVNLKIDYLLTKHFSAFVNLNNILGKQYQRYQYYPQQGLNFVGGLSFSF